MGFSIITKRDPGNRHFQALRSGISEGKKITMNSTFVVDNDENMLFANKLELYSADNIIIAVCGFT